MYSDYLSQSLRDFFKNRQMVKMVNYMLYIFHEKKILSVHKTMQHSQKEQQPCRYFELL